MADPENSGDTSDLPEDLVREVKEHAKTHWLERDEVDPRASRSHGRSLSSWGTQEAIGGFGRHRGEHREPPVSTADVDPVWRQTLRKLLRGPSRAPSTPPSGRPPGGERPALVGMGEWRDLLLQDEKWIPKQDYLLACCYRLPQRESVKPTVGPHAVGAMFQG